MITFFTIYFIIGLFVSAIETAYQRTFKPYTHDSIDVVAFVTSVTLWPLVLMIYLVNLIERIVDWVRK